MLGHGPHEACVGCEHSGLLLPVHAPRRKTAVRACHARLSETYSRDSSHALCHRRAVWAGVLATVDHDSSLQVMRVWLNGFRLLLPVFEQLHAASSAFSCKPARNLRRWSVGLRLMAAATSLGASALYPSTPLFQQLPKGGTAQIVVRCPDLQFGSLKP